MEKIPVVIIETPGLNRSQPILKVLENNFGFKVIRLKATMGYELQLPSEPQIEQELINYGRVLSQNERACAISHQNARKIISETILGGIILEDDARIEDLPKLLEYSKKFLNSTSYKKRVLSLISYYPKISKSISTKGLIAVPVPSPFSLAVAYLLTKNAAHELSSFSQNYVADWPPSKCRYFILRNGVVRHGDEKSVSTIGELNNRLSHTALALRYIIKFLPVTKIPYIIAFQIKKKIAEKLTMKLTKFIQKY